MAGVMPVSDGGRVEVARAVGDLAAAQDVAPLATASSHQVDHVPLLLGAGQRADVGRRRPSGRPTRCADMCSTNRRSNSSATSTWAMKRLAAMQDWPLFRQRAWCATSAARSRSAEGMTMNGSLPPSSSTDFLTTSPAIDGHRRPAGPDPVRVTADHPVVPDDRLDPVEAPISSVWNDARRGTRPGRTAPRMKRAVCGDVGGVLEQADVAGHERRGGEPHGLPQREVPRHHGQHRAERLPAGVGAGRADGAGVGRLVGQEGLGVLGEVAARLGALERLGLGRGQGLAHLGGHHGGDRGRPRPPGSRRPGPSSRPVRRTRWCGSVGRWRRPGPGCARPPGRRSPRRSARWCRWRG